MNTTVFRVSEGLYQQNEFPSEDVSWSSKGFKAKINCVIGLFEWF